MGKAKHMLELGYSSDLDLDLDLDENICSTCIDEVGISNFIINNQDPNIDCCSYCNETEALEGFKACNFGLVVEHIFLSISAEWCDPAKVLPYQSAEGGYQGEVIDTEELLYYLGVNVDDEKIITDIAGCIENGYWCRQDYSSLSPNKTLVYGWKSFCEFVISKSRYFFLQAENNSYDPDQHDEMNPVDILKSVTSIISELGMFKDLLQTQELIRVRIVDDYSEAASASELGSPPLKYCTMANRMSPAGISMFYGAFDLETAVKETYEPEPEITKKAVVGHFYPTRKLKLIDLSKPFRVPSIFDEEQSHRFEKSFLFGFIEDFTKQIERAYRAHIDYVPTQIVTEYLKVFLFKNKSTLIDGVIYPSAKNQGHKAVVIFADNAQCNDEKLSPDSETLLSLRSFKAVDLEPFN
jgi:hypothetical protein